MGGSSKAQTVGYKYFLGMHMVMCHGPVDAVTRIQVDRRTAWTGNQTSTGQIQVNAPNLFGGDEREGGIGGLSFGSGFSLQSNGKVDVEMGLPTQGRNDYLQAQLGADIPAFRRVLGLVLRKVYLGNNPYLKPWSIRAKRIHVRQDGIPQWNDAAADVGGDMNPAHIIREILTDPDWGMGYPEEDMDETSFLAAAATLLSEGMGMSILWDKQKSIDDFLSVVLSHIDGSLYIDRSTGKFVLKLARGGYDASTLPLLDEECVARVSDFKRSTVAELTNQVTVIFWDKSTGKDNSVTVQDIALAANQQATVGTTLQYPGFTNGTIASRVASRDLRALSTPLASATLYVNRKAASLNVGDVFRFSWEEYGVDQLVFRVTNIELGELANNLVKLNVIEDVFSLSQAIYAPPAPSEWTPPSMTPVPVSSRLVTNVPYYMLARQLGDTAAADLAATAGYVMVAGVRPGTAFNAQVHVNEGGGYAQQTMLDFCATATLSAAVGPDVLALPITGGQLLDTIDIGDYVVMGSGVGDFEICEVQSLTDTACNVKRGMMDTTPALTTALGTRLMFIGRGEFAAALAGEYTSGESISIKMLPVTGEGVLDIASATADTIVVNPRQDRPYPPGLFRVNAQAYPATIEDAVTVTWAHRDRLQQTADTLVDQNAASVGPEVGTSYTVRFMAQGSGGTVKKTVSGLATTTYTYTLDDQVVDGVVDPMRVELWSVRGGVASLFKQVWEFSHPVSLGGPDLALYIPGIGADASASVLDYGGTARAVTVAGNAQVDTAQSVRGGSSVLFDGSGDYLSVTSTSDFDLSKAWTMECHVRFNAVSNTWLWSKTNGGFTLGLILNVFNTNGINVLVNPTGTRIPVLASPVVNTWYRVTVTYDGSRVRAYLDGTLTGGNDAALTAIADSLGFGRNSVSNSEFLNGWLDEVYWLRKNVCLLLQVGSGAQVDRIGLHPVTVSGVGAVSAAQTKFGTESFYNGGTNTEATSWVRSLAADQIYRFGPGMAFCMEGWFRIASYPSTYQNFFSSDTFGAAGSGGFQAGVTSSGQLYITTNPSGTNHVYASNSGAVALNNWFHVAFTRNASGTMRIWLNGFSVGGAFSTSDDFSTETIGQLLGGSTSAICIGKGLADFPGGTNADLDAYWEDVRVVRGSPVYTQTFVPRAGRFRHVSQFHGEVNVVADQFEGVNGATAHEELNGRSWSKGSGTDTSISTSQFKWGTSSLRIGPTSGNDYFFLTSHPNYALGTGDFTLRFWMRPNATGNNQAVFDMRTAITEPRLTVLTGASGALRLFVNGTDRITSAAGVLTASAWAHVEICRVSGVTRMFVNGVQAGSDWADATDYTAGPVYLGTVSDAPGSSSFHYVGYIDDLQLKKGIGLHSAGFSVPAGPHD
jgi:hypothetical protein